MAAAAQISFNRFQPNISYGKALSQPMLSFFQCHVALAFVQTCPNNLYWFLYKFNLDSSTNHSSDYLNLSSKRPRGFVTFWCRFKLVLIEMTTV